jgi:hypothetical protein
MKPEILPPLSASLHVKPAGWRFGLRLWLPLFLLWLILLPLLLVVLPLLFVGSLIFRFNLWRSLRAANGVLAATRGTQVEVDNRESRVFIKLHGKDMS